MNVSFRQLRLFLALAETGSVSAAAKVMHVTQPTASMQLRDIAESVGLPLYELVGKKLYLTQVGQELAQTARAVAHTWDTFEQNVDAAKGLSRGKLRVAVVSTAKYFMPHLIGSFCKRHPAIDVSLEILNRDGVVQRLRDLGDEAFMPNPIVVIAPTTDPLSKRSSVPLHELAQRRFILREKGSGTRMAADQFFRAMKFRPDVRLELGSNEAIKESVAGGLGVGVVSRHALHGHQKENGVSVVDVQGFPLTSAWHIVYPAGKKLSPLALAFKQHVLQQISRRK